MSNTKNTIITTYTNIVPTYDAIYTINLLHARRCPGQWSLGQSFAPGQFPVGFHAAGSLANFDDGVPILQMKCHQFDISYSQQAGSDFTPCLLWSYAKCYMATTTIYWQYNINMHVHM